MKKLINKICIVFQWSITFIMVYMHSTIISLLKKDFRIACLFGFILGIINTYITFYELFD